MLLLLIGQSISIRYLHTLLVAPQDIVALKGLFLNRASDWGLRFDSSTDCITSHTDVRLQLHLLSVTNVPFTHLEPRRIPGYFNDALFPQGEKKQKLCKHAQRYSLRRLGTNETTNFLTKHVPVCIFLEETLESSKFSFSCWLAFIILAAF